MKTSLQEIYFDLQDRIFLNQSPAKSKYKIAREQIKKDEELKIQIEEVFKNPENYDVYYKKDTLELCIDNMPDDKGMRQNIFNRIEIKY